MVFIGKREHIDNMILKTEVLSMQRYKIKSINNQKHNKITPQRSNFYLP
jgi:hypothetical protein